MKALSIRQPWAWMIIHAGKDIENRDWPTKVRGRVLIHASKGMTRTEFLSVWEWANLRGFRVPSFESISRGGIVGSVEIINCVESSASFWFQGRYGFVLRNPQPMAFQPCRGALGFFEVPEGTCSS